eukprot:UN05841
MCRTHFILSSYSLHSSLSHKPMLLLRNLSH